MLLLYISITTARDFMFTLINNLNGVLLKTHILLHLRKLSFNLGRKLVNLIVNRIHDV